MSSSAVESAMLDAARLEPGQDVLVLGGGALALGAHELIGDGWVYVVRSQVDELEELLGGNEASRELVVRDYHANPEPLSKAEVAATLDELDNMSDAELLDFTTMARVFGYPSTAEAQDSAVSSRGYRAMSEIPRLQFAHADRLVREFGSLQGLLAASAGDLEAVEGIGEIWARHVREGLSQLAESTIGDPIN